MIRPLAVAVLAALLLPASAEAAKLRSGGSRSHGTNASQPHRDSSHVVVTPTLRSRQVPSAATPQPLHIASPAAIAAAEANGLRRGEPAEPRIWCRSQVVVGGFCVLN